MAQLKLGRLPDRVPIKVTVSVPPELKRALDDYAALYRETYGDDQPVTELIPEMLATFLASDRDFVRSRGQKS